MRISTGQMQNNALTSMLERQAELSKTQTQVASGQRFQTPSEDVIATTQVLALQKVISTHIQYDENSYVADAKLVEEESVISTTIDALQRARELAVQSQNTSYGPESRAALAVEVREILREIMSLANSTDSAGEYIFAGYNVGTTPFTETENPPASGLFDFAYTGDLGQRAVQIGANRFMAVGDSGQNVFIDIPESGGGFQNVFETIEQLAIDLESNVVSATAPDDLSLAMQHLTGVRSAIGARENAIERFRFLNDDIILQSKKTLSDVRDLDFAEAISRMNLQLAGLEASQQSFARIQGLSLFNFL